MPSLRPSLYEVLHGRFSVTQGLLSLAAGFGLIYAHASFSWFRHPAPLIGAVLLAVLVASINNNNWRRTLGSTFFAAAGGAIGMIDPRCMPGNLIFLALLGWINSQD